MKTRSLNDKETRAALASRASANSAKASGAKKTVLAFDSLKYSSAVEALETAIFKSFRYIQTKALCLCIVGSALVGALRLEASAGAEVASGLEYDAKADSAQALEKIAPKSASELAAHSFYFGTPARLNVDIAGESGIPAEELRISYKFTGDPPIERPYSMPFEGELIPAYSRTLDVAILRVAESGADASRRRQILWEGRFEPRQTPPVFETAKASVELLSPKGKNAKPGECSFALKGVRVLFAQPIDAEQGKQIVALVNDLEVAEAGIDKEATRLQFFTANDKPDDALNAALQSASISVSSFFDSGVYLLTVVVKNLPKSALKGKKLRGSVGIRLGVKLLNRRAMRAAEIEETLVLPVALSM